MRFNTERVKLKSVCEIKYGKDHKKLGDGNIPTYGSGGLMRYVDKSIHNKKSVLIPRKGSLSNLFLVEPPFWTVDTLFWTDIDTQKIHPDFLYYQLCTMDLASRNVGTAVPSLTTTLLNELEIMLPSMEIQEQIVSTLAVLDAKITQNAKINDNLQQQASALYGKYFPYAVTDDLPAGWRIGTVGEIVEIHDSKRIPLSGAQRAKMEKRIYPYYGAASLMDYVDEYIFDGIYLLLGEDGTVVDDAGYPILQYVWGQFWVNNHAHILTGKLGFNVESLLLLFKRTPVKSIVTGAVQPKISQANLRSVQVVIPPQTELDAFNELIRPMFDQIRQNQNQNKVLATMRDSLLPKLMSGEIDVSNIDI